MEKCIWILGVSIQSSMYFDSPKMGGQKTIKSYSSNCDLLVIYCTNGRSKTSPSTNPSVSVVQQPTMFSFIPSSFANIPTATVSRTCVAWVWPFRISMEARNLWRRRLLVVSTQLNKWQIWLCPKIPIGIRNMFQQKRNNYIHIPYICHT